MRFKGPCRVGAKLGWNPQRTQKRPRFHVASDDHRVLDVTLAHGLNDPVHVTCLAAVSKRNLVFSRSQSQRTNHHGGEGVSKLALEHRAFAGNDAVILPHLATRRKSVMRGLSQWHNFSERPEWKATAWRESGIYFRGCISKGERHRSRISPALRPAQRQHGNCQRQCSSRDRARKL